MPKMVLLAPEQRRALLGMVLDAGGGPAAAQKIARRFNAHWQTLARWIVGMGGPFETDRDAIERACAKWWSAKADAS